MNYGSVLEPRFNIITISGSVSEPERREKSMDDKRAMTWDQFLNSNFEGRDYEFPDFEGSYNATIACKRWTRNNDLVLYLDLDDGRKVITMAWADADYLGAADLPVGSNVLVIFVFSKSGRSYLDSIEQI